jgi:hypothetical protein
LLAHSPVHYGIFTPTGRTVLLITGETAQLWEVPRPLEGGVEQVVGWTETLTGQRVEASGVAHALDAPNWYARRQRFAGKGGPPLP